VGDPQIDAVVDTLPIAEFARVMRMNEADLRIVTRASVARALATGGSVDNIRKVMQGAIDHARRR
jgi:hypothetical protein